MGSNQLYSLTWGEFGTSLVSAVQLLRCHGDLVDVTLAAGGRSFPAHKIVLCAASPFLLNLLKSTPCKHPVVMLAGVTATDLEALLEFVYRGEVSVDPNQLPSLLQAAHCLNIQGLAPGTISSEKPDDLSTTLPSTHEALTRDVINSFLPIRRRKRTKRRNSTGSGSSSAGKWPRQEGDVENLSLEQQHVGGAAMGAEHDVLVMPEMAGKTESEQKSHSSDEQASKKNSVSDQPATCPLCGATLRQSRNLRRHLELLHFGVGRSTVKVRTRKSSGPQQTATHSGSVSDPGAPHQSHIPVSSVHQPNMSSPPNTTSQSQPQPMPHMSHMLVVAPPHCQNPTIPGQARPRHEDLCESSPVLSCMLPIMPTHADPMFRQHHSDMLRGAGLYAGTRVPSKIPGSSDMRQEVA